MVLDKLPVPGVLLTWIIVGQGPTALTGVAGGDCLDIFLSSIISLFFLPLWEPARYTLKYSQRAVKPKTSNQPCKRRRITHKRNKNFKALKREFIKTLIGHSISPSNSRNHGIKTICNFKKLYEINTEEKIY